MTRNGIVYNLIESPYVVEYEGIRFFFSSSLHMEKFRKQASDLLLGYTPKAMIRVNMRDRLKVNECGFTLSLLDLYTRIETRGFGIQIEGEFYKWVDVKLQPVLIGRKSEAQT